MILKGPVAICLLLWSIVLWNSEPVSGQQPRTISPIDRQATKETVNLLNNLKKLLADGFMFGHQDDLAYGVGWKYIQGRSDVKDVTGDYPAVQGYELGHLEIDHLVNLDSVPFDRMKDFIRLTYEKGGVATLSWHLRNPYTGKTAWDPAPGTVRSVLPGGEKHELYKSWLDKVALFANDLKGKSGEYIPVIFRPFHELNGSWFWWGKNHCTPAEFKALWKFTIGYLRDTKQIHHFLYAFNTDKFKSKEEYLERFPGSEWVDVIGFDVYQRDHGEKANAEFIRSVSAMLTVLENIASEQNKIPAITEFGYSNLPDSTWWTNVFYKALEGHQVSFALAWRNAGFKPHSGEHEYYVPYPGQGSAADFRRFYKMKRTLFLQDVGTKKMYDD